MKSQFTTSAFLVIASALILTALKPEEDAQFWIQGAQATLRERLAVEPVKAKARNIVLFIGDGMSIPTLVAARIFSGQRKGFDGEEQTLSFERFPFIGFAKTYCVDAQVAEGACSATALLSGVKTHQLTVNVDPSVDTANFSETANPCLKGIVTWAQAAGMRTGLVTTARVTHATPACAYACTPSRFWESDEDTFSLDDMTTFDIAKQLVYTDPGRKMNVVLGGGRLNFQPMGTDNFDCMDFGNRFNDEDLIQTWIDYKKTSGVNASYVGNRESLLQVDKKSIDSLLGLVDCEHLQYHARSNDIILPSLAEMVEAAIQVLQNGPNGFFLLVEGGLIDIAHHSNNAQDALDETIEMSLAVETVLRMTDAKDTLVVVTSDHAQTMTMSGYSKRGSSLFTTVGEGTDHLPYSKLSYGNGPGYKMCGEQRCDLDLDDLTDREYPFPATAPRGEATHGGDDVAVFATGPWSHLFTGSFEQNYIPHALAYAACIGDGPKFCDSPLPDGQRHRRATSGTFVERADWRAVLLVLLVTRL